METAYYYVVKGGLDWYGLEVTQHTPTSLLIHEGRVGISDNPLYVENGTVSGGYYFPETEVEYSASDRSIDLLLCHDNQQLYLLVRSQDEKETYDGDSYRLLLSLAVRYSDTNSWIVAAPLRDSYEST